jgi:hypothetical protein
MPPGVPTINTVQNVSEKPISPPNLVIPSNSDVPVASEPEPATLQIPGGGGPPLLTQMSMISYHYEDEDGEETQP